ncbi:SwmB domain-containing protein [Phenylobacterium sp. LjRoot164]|uniref:DUF4347 domain-containing protein n=1 Tax=unclassified Phenylobacterium TaxID=2640670 RepID=UPI003ED0D088
MLSLEVAAGNRSEVVFVDTRVEGYETIVAGVAPGAEVVLIDASGDGVAQMAQALAGRTDIAAIHIVGHGQAGVIMLGSATLGVGDIDAYAGELRAIGGALAPDGDIQLWGCEVGAGPEGAAFIQALAAATGADIAASDDLTGAGGDWVLETQTGVIETSVAITAAGQHAFAGTLAIGSENFDSLGLITTSGTTLTAGNWQFTSSGDTDHAVVSSDEFAVWLNNDEGGASDRAVVLNYSGQSITTYAMKSADGTNFALQSFKIGQSAGATQTLTIAAFSNGVQVVAPETVNLAASDSTGGVNYALGGNDGSGAYGTLTFSSAYANIDEIRFVFGGLSDLHIDDIAVAPAVVDVTAPVFVSAAVNGATLVMTYNEANTLDAVNAPAAGRFAVTADGASVAVNSVAVNASAKTVTLTLQSAVTAGQAVTVAYTDPTGGDDASAIQDAVGNDAASLPATSVTNNTLDPPPSVSGTIAVPANGSYAAGQTLSFTVTFNENVTVVGTDSVLGLTIGSTAREAVFASSTANSVTYAYTVQAGETDANGVAVGGITLGATTIRDSAGNDANLTLAGHVPSTAGILVDTTAPAVASVSVPANATYVAGQHLDFTVNFDENVTVTGNDSALALTVGSASRSATFLSSGGNTITYRYVAQAGDIDANGITVGGLSLGASTIRDGAGNNAVLTLNSVGSTSGVLVDATVPSVAGAVSVPANATYIAGQTLSFTVAFDENVIVTGTGSTLGLTLGATSRTATYASKTANSITYTYTVQAGDNDVDGIAVNGVSLNGGTIRDGAGNNANLSLSGHLPATAGVLVDTAAPAFVSASVNGATLVITYSDASLLDAAHAPAAGAFSVMVGGAPVSVTAVAVNGAAHTVTLTLATPVAAGAAVTVAYADPTGGDDAHAIQDIGGNDAASLAAASVTNNTPTPTPTPDPTPTSPPVTTTVDGVQVQTQTSTAPDGSVNQVVTIPVVQAGRVEQVGNNAVADIPLVKDSAGQALLALQVPVGYGLQASGPAQPKPAGDALTDLIREIRAHTSISSQDQGRLGGAGTDFVNGLDTSTPLLVQTIVTSGADTAPGARPLTISGQPQAVGQPQTALVIDGRSNPGVHIELQNVEFAAIIGNATVTGGAGSQHVWGDGASQTIFLGADDDVLHGGGGNDTVGSAGGADEVYGDDGDDVVFGGEGADFVHGNAGNDTARGDAGDDRVYGGKGDDQVFGGADNDQLFGDLGQDTLQGNTGHDTLDGGGGDDLMFGGQHNDLLLGGEGDDRLNGDLGNDTLQGNTGSDTLEGGAGADLLYGGQDNDVLHGGDGADTLIGDRGDDTLTGGAGADLYVTGSGRGEDRVLDFNFAEGDRVGLLAGTTYSTAQVGGDTVITLTGGGQMTLVNVQLSGLGDGWITTM